jgi:hypothetical protein
MEIDANFKLNRKKTQKTCKKMREKDRKCILLAQTASLETTGKVGYSYA